ncbi:MAG: DUF2459 domain-containing protein [Betaproteobacteria bacterium]|nr:DUF2459 domain-containing protein [Betaproteobacteria bacterium]
MARTLSGRQRGRRARAGIAAVVSLLLVTPSAGSGALTPSPQARRSAASASAAVAVADEGWHTGLIVRPQSLARVLPKLRHWFPHARYLLIGWGNRRFYMAPNPGLGAALAALAPSRSILLVQGLRHFPDRSPALYGARIRWLCLPRRGMHRLAEDLSGYFIRGPAEDLVPVGPGASTNSEFFASTGTYDVLHTCNTWVAAALRAGGLPVHARGVVFAPQVMDQLRTLPPCSG